LRREEDQTRSAEAAEGRREETEVDMVVDDEAGEVEEVPVSASSHTNPEEEAPVDPERPFGSAAVFEIPGMAPMGRVPVKPVEVSVP
jgi:hypothetical protein